MGKVTVSGTFDITVNGQNVNRQTNSEFQGNQVEYNLGLNISGTLNHPPVGISFVNTGYSTAPVIGRASQDDNGFGMEAIATQYGEINTIKTQLYGIGISELALCCQAGFKPNTWASTYPYFNLGAPGNIYGYQTSNVVCQFFWVQTNSPDGTPSNPGNVNINSNVRGGEYQGGEPTWGTNPAMGLIPYQTEGTISGIPWIVLLTDQVNSSENGVYFVTYNGYVNGYAQWFWVKAPDWGQYLSNWKMSGTGPNSIIEVYKLPQAQPLGVYGYALPPQPPIVYNTTDFWPGSYIWKVMNKTGTTFGYPYIGAPVGRNFNVLITGNMTVPVNGVCVGNDKQLYINAGTGPTYWRPDWSQIQPTGTWYQTYTYPTIGSADATFSDDNLAVNIDCSYNFQPTASLMLYDTRIPSIGQPTNTLQAAQVDLYMNGTDYYGTWNTTTNYSSPATINVNVWGGGDYPIGAGITGGYDVYHACGIFNALIWGQCQLTAWGDVVGHQFNINIGADPATVAAAIQNALNQYPYASTHYGSVSVKAVWNNSSNSKAYNVFLQSPWFACRNGARLTLTCSNGTYYEFYGQCAFPNGVYQFLPQSIPAYAVAYGRANNVLYEAPLNYGQYCTTNNVEPGFSALQGWLNTVPGGWTMTLQQLDNYYWWYASHPSDPVPAMQVWTSGPMGVAIPPVRAVITYSNGWVYDSYNPPAGWPGQLGYKCIGGFPLGVFDPGQAATNATVIGTPSPSPNPLSGTIVITTPFAGAGPGTSGGGTTNVVGSSESDTDMWHNPVFSGNQGLYIGNGADNTFNLVSDASVYSLTLNKDNNSIAAIGGSNTAVNIPNPISGSNTVLSTPPTGSMWCLKTNSLNHNNIIGVYVDSGNNLWFVQSIDNGKTWKTPVEIDNSGGVTGKGSVFSLNGLVVVIWSSASNLQFCESSNGTTFTAPTTIAAGAFSGITCVRDGLDNLYVLAQDSSDNPHLYISTNYGVSFTEVSTSTLPQINTAITAEILTCWIDQGVLSIVGGA